ncbi:MAG: NAD(P)-dependent oxidoreductase [Candidatus Marinimicrobia bacterium]|nr:NAD(P)-dependent oxidoreductase [Candidatus Neomarinimicrobiota bacterium]
MTIRKRILITGASGTVGSALLEQITRNNNEFDITVFDMDTKRTRGKFQKYKNEIHCIYGDITNPDDVDAACMEQDVVIHLAAVIPPLADRKMGLAKRVNINGTQNIIKALETYSPGAFLCYASSISVYGDRLNDPKIRVHDPLKPSEGDYYAQTKIEAESLLRNSRLDWAIFRLTAIMGVNNHKVSPIMFHVPLETRIEIATPEDTARAFFYAINKKSHLLGKTFNLSGGELCRTTYKQFLKRSFTLFGLGKLNFPVNAFAKRNFHCGYYMDGDQLERILHFRQDTLDSYFKKVRSAIPGIQRFFTKIFCPLIKKSLLRKSDPRKAVRKKDITLIYRFFGNKALERMIPSAR